MFNPRFPLLLFGFIVVSVSAALAPLSLEAAQFVPHRAAYTVKLTNPQPGSSIVSGQGVMSIQIEKSCDGWITGQTWHMTMNTADGNAFKHDIRYATWESFDGLSYRFSTRDQSGKKTENIKGRATLESVPGKGEVVYQQPKEKTLALEDDTIFPIAHVVKLLESAKKGDHLVPFVLFDGASKKGPLRVITFISEKQDGRSAELPIKHKLLNETGWNMRMAFFPAHGQAPEPQYELEVLQLANGVVPVASQEFPEFTVELKLKKLEALEPMKCS